MERSHKWPVLVSMCLVVVMLSIDATAVNIAIPLIAHQFNASLTNLQWVINAFFLLCAMVQIIGGHLGDSYGHKKLFLINLALFILASLGVGLSRNEYAMIGFRALQGATLGIAFPSTWILLFSAFPKEQTAFASSFFVSTMGIFLAAGTPIGAFFIHTLGWPWIFYINIPIGLISLFLAWKYCKADAHLSKKPLDIKGTFFLILSLFGFAFGINQVQNWGFLSLPFLSFMALGILFLFFLYLNERKAEDRLIHFDLFKIRNYSFHCLLRAIVQIVFLSLLFFFPLYLQNVLGNSVVISGCILLFMTVIMALLSPIAGKWVDASGDKMTILFSMSLFLVLAFLMLGIGTSTQYGLLGIILLLAGTSISIAFVSSQTGVQLVIPETKKGAAMAIYLTIAWLACSLGVSLSGTAIALGSEGPLQKQLHSSQITLSPDEYRLAQRAARGLSPTSSLANPQVQQITKAAFVSGLHANAWVFILVSSLGIVLALSLKRTRK